MPPELTETIAERCPPLSQLTDNSIGTLAVEDANAAVAYAACQRKHSTVVNLYSQMRQELIAARRVIEEEIEKLNER